MEPTECSETPAFNMQTPGKYPEENIRMYTSDHLATAKNTNLIWKREESALYLYVSPPFE
jgi:hypothetical protein